MPFGKYFQAMTKQSLNLLFVLLFSSTLFSQQPDPCIDPLMVPFCSDACVICDINGFTGRNSNQTRGIAPDDFCTTRVHHISWISFIAGTPNLTLEVDVSNCQLNLGLEIGIYESLDCEVRNMRRVSNCDTDVRPGETGVFTNTVPLVVGQYYYFVMDGSNDDVCNYTVRVRDGSTAVGALEEISRVEGPRLVCPGDTVTFNVPPRFGANFEEWRIDGDIVATQDTQLTYVWDEIGNFEVCYLAYNVCDTIPEVCLQVAVRELPKITYTDTLCANACIYVVEMDTVICDPGLTQLSYKLPDGCTQRVDVELVQKPTPMSGLVLEFCYGDSVKIGDNYYTEPDNYAIPLSGNDGCDSIVNLSLTTFLCDIDGGLADANLDCPGETTATLSFTLVDGNPPFSYNWEEKTGTGLNGSGTSNTGSNSVDVAGLSAGIYSITIVDSDNNRGVFVGQVFEPDPLLSETMLSEYNGFQITCPGGNDGSISISTDGGTPPYEYKWSDTTTSNTDSRTELEAGDYSISVIDSKGCEVVLNPSLTAPDPIVFDLNQIPPRCNPENSGSITVNGIKGGAGPFEFSIDGGGFQADSIFFDLPKGTYELRVRDANGCESAPAMETLDDPNSLILELGDDITINLGDSLLLTPNINNPDVTYNWESPTQPVICPDCPALWVRPFANSTYIITTTLDNDCERKDSINIIVTDIRRVYAPSAFSPNNDGINDAFKIYGGPEVLQIEEFKVFSRWGDLLFSDEGFEPNEAQKGWDGSFRGSELDTGLYTWFAKVEFIDGRIDIYEGDISLVR